MRSGREPARCRRVDERRNVGRDLVVPELDERLIRRSLMAINEFGACDVLPQDTLNRLGCAPSIASAQWGTFAAAFTQWALCSPALNVESVQPEYWGDLPTTDTNALLALVSSNGTLTPYGQSYLGEARWLTTNGCSRLGASH